MKRVINDKDANTVELSKISESKLYALKLNGVLFIAHAVDINKFRFIDMRGSWGYSDECCKSLRELIGLYISAGVHTVYEFDNLEELIKFKQQNNQSDD